MDHILKQAVGWLMCVAMFTVGCSDETESDSTKTASAETKSTAKSEQPKEQKPASRKPASTPDGAVRQLIAGLAEGKGEVLWDSLPPQYRADVNTMVRGLGAKVDPEVWKQSLGTWLRVVTLIDKKKELVAESGVLAKAPITDQQFKALTPHAAAILKMLLNSELRDTAQLQTFDGRDFCRGTFSVVLLEIKNAIRDVADVSLSQFLKDAVSIHATQVEDDSAIVEIMIRGSQFPPIKLPMNKVGQHWIPTDLAETWPTAIAMVRSQIDTMPATTETTRSEKLKAIAAVGKVLDGFELAKSENDFNSVLAQLTPFLFGTPAPTDPATPNTPATTPQPKGTVNIVVTNKLTNAQIDELVETWERLAGDPDRSEVDVFEKDGQTVFVVEPVGDVSAFAKKIDFVDELELDPKNRSIRITLPKPE